MEAKTLPDASAIFRCFAACPHDPKTLLLDVRPHKQFEKLHLALSYNIRLSANGRVLLVSVLSHGGVAIRLPAHHAVLRRPRLAMLLPHALLLSPCRTTRRTSTTFNSPRTAGETSHSPADDVFVHAMSWSRLKLERVPHEQKPRAAVQVGQAGHSVRRAGDSQGPPGGQVPLA